MGREDLGGTERTNAIQVIQVSKVSHVACTLRTDKGMVLITHPVTLVDRLRPSAKAQVVYFHTQLPTLFICYLLPVGTCWTCMYATLVVHDLDERAVSVL